MSNKIIIAALAVAAIASGQGQIEVPKNNRYEVVSIKPSASGQNCGYHPSPLQLTLENCSLRYLITSVYPAPRYDMTGLPKWASSESFTIAAKSVGPANYLEQWAMLRAVLEDRFKLKYHREKRQMPVYFLSAAPGGIRFRETVPGSCQPLDPNVGPRPPEVSKSGEMKFANDCARWLNQQLHGGGIRVTASGVTMAQLAGDLRPYFDRPVVEQTGSSKLFDIDLSFVRSDLTVSDTNVDPSGLPTIFDALKKAGLSAKPGEGAVEVLVIDQLERPSEN